VLPHTLAMALLPNRWLWHLMTDTAVLNRGLALEVVQHMQEQVAPWEAGSWLLDSCRGGLLLAVSKVRTWPSRRGCQSRLPAAALCLVDGRVVGSCGARPVYTCIFLLSEAACMHFDDSVDTATPSMAFVCSWRRPQSCCLQRQCCHLGHPIPPSSL